MSLTRVEVTSGIRRDHYVATSRFTGRSLLEWVFCWVHTEVFWVCTNHALTTEAEEIMGLLLGDVIVRLEVFVRLCRAVTFREVAAADCSKEMEAK